MSILILIIYIYICNISIQDHSWSQYYSNLWDLWGSTFHIIYYIIVYLQIAVVWGQDDSKHGVSISSWFLVLLKKLTNFFNIPAKAEFSQKELKRTQDSIKRCQQKISKKQSAVHHCKNEKSPEWPKDFFNEHLKFANIQPWPTVATCLAWCSCRSWLVWSGSLQSFRVIPGMVVGSTQASIFAVARNLNASGVYWGITWCYKML